MYKLLIADDEPIVLESLKSFPWADYDCQVICWAEDGQKALHALDSEYPDIIISDIRMPTMGGLELSQAIKKISPGTEIILLTGYAEFNYAKQAMSLGIKQYLLKPFRFEDIEKALVSCIQILEERENRCQQQRQIQEKLQHISPLLTEHVYQDLLEGRIEDYSKKITVCNIQESLYMVISIQGDSPGTSMDIALYAQIKELLKGTEQVVYLAQSIDIIICIFRFAPKHSSNFCKDSACHICKMISDTIFQQLGFKLSFGISLSSSDIFMLHHLKEQSVQALNWCNTLGKNSLVMYSDIQRNQKHDIFNMAIYEKKIQKCIIQKQAEEFDHIYQELVMKLLQSSHGDFSYIRKSLINLVVLTYRFAESYGTSVTEEYDAIEHLFHYESIEALSKEVHFLLSALVQTESNSFSDGIAEKITEYLKHNLEQNISLDTLSQAMNYSTSYLSRLIKKITGQTFSELLQELRLKRAMELLRLTDMRINDIAIKVGYNDVSYFISIFKKQTGVTPKEWRILANLIELSPSSTDGT